MQRWVLYGGCNRPDFAASDELAPVEAGFNMPLATDFALRAGLLVRSMGRLLGANLGFFLVPKLVAYR